MLNIIDEYTRECLAIHIGRQIDSAGVKTAFIEPGSLWENGYIESFNGKLRDELLKGEIFETILEVRVITEQLRNHYNKIRPHSSLIFDLR